MAGRSAEDELLDRFTDAEVKQAIEVTAENFRMAVLLADVEGFAYKEIAEILDIPIGTVMSRLHREERRCRSSCTSSPSIATSRRQHLTTPMSTAKLRTSCTRTLTVS